MHEEISDCAVVSIPNEEWGVLTVAVLICSPNTDLIQLDKWLRTRMASYKTPRKY